MKTIKQVLLAAVIVVAVGSSLGVYLLWGEVDRMQADNEALAEGYLSCSTFRKIQDNVIEELMDPKGQGYWIEAYNQWKEKEKKIARGNP